MTSQDHSPSVTYTPNSFQSRRLLAVPNSSAQPLPVRPPPAIHLGPQTHSHSGEQSQTYEGLKRGHGSTSSESTDSSRHTALHPGVGSTNTHSPTFAMSSQVEQGTREVMHPARAYPSRYTRPSRSEMTEINAAYQYSQDGDETSDMVEDHAIWVLVWLSLLDPLYCLLAALYTLFILVPLLLLTPLHLCRSTCDLPNSIIRFISPALRYHLKMLRVESGKELVDLKYKPFSLIMVYLAAPFLSAGVAVAAWISASFWIFAITMGNPDGTERRDDGRATVLGVRNWWERCLLSAVR